MPVTTRPHIELTGSPVEAAKSFTPSGSSFHVRTCHAHCSGIPCGHEAAIRATGQCTGCDERQEEVNLCRFHLDAYLHGQVIFHAFPCGMVGLGLALFDIQEL